MELKDFQGPALIAGMAVTGGYLLEKLTGKSFGIKTSSLPEAMQAFALVTAAGGAMLMYYKRQSK